MAILNRRHFIQAAGAAAAALPLAGGKALAADKVKVGFIFLGPIGEGVGHGHQHGGNDAEKTADPVYAGCKRQKTLQTFLP